jgi:hypothetical protein
MLAFAGLRGVVRALESLEHSELPPHCYETLDRERVLNSLPPNPSSELFACGCVWWHLLTGRPPIAGGNSRAKVLYAAAEQVPDVRRIAPDTPEVLAELIAACTSVEPAHRPRSFAEMARILGPPAERGDRAIAKAMRKAERWVLPRQRQKMTRRRLLQPLADVGAVAACLLLVVTAWRVMTPTSGTSKPAVAKQAVHSAALAAIQQPPSATTPVIEQVAYEQPVVAPTSSKEPEPLRLPEGRTIRLASLTPVAGQRICGENGGRVVVSLPVEGLTIDADDLRFENIDFQASKGTDASPAMLILRAPTATFSGCRFLGDEAAESPPVAIRWLSTTEDDWLPTDECLKFESCAFHGADAAIDKGSSRTASIEFSNVLQTRSNCLVRCSLASESRPLCVELDRCTLRNTGAVVQITEIATLESRLDRLRVAAADSVFQLNPQRALIELPVEFDEAQLSQIKWMGSGSLCSLPSQLAAVVENGEQAEAVDDAKLEISGLARSTLDFAGDDLDAAASSELRRWVAARRSKAPPGISASENAAPAVTPDQ